MEISRWSSEHRERMPPDPGHKKIILNPAMESPRKTRKDTEEEDWEKQGIHLLGQRSDGCIRFPFRAFRVFSGLHSRF